MYYTIISDHISLEYILICNYELGCSIEEVRKDKQNEHNPI